STQDSRRRSGRYSSALPHRPHPPLPMWYRAYCAGSNLCLRRQKTGTPYHIMLLPIAQELIERYRGYPGKIDETRVFPVKDRKSMCTTIKRIAQKCGITKNLSTHIGRHTFGTTVTLEKGVPIETVSEMLGHKQITTTQIYAKLTANKMKEDVRLLTQRIGNLYELT
ncbi:site-specific integrase, partial [Alistipes shahii]|uniref:site-specific integrase n=2 Tax=Alistipes shahii TaxID=328814 RepID=UPI003AB09E2C